MLKGLYVDQVVPSQSWVGTVVHGFVPTADQHFVQLVIYELFGHKQLTSLNEECGKNQRTNLPIVELAAAMTKALLLREAVILTNTLSIPFQC